MWFRDNCPPPRRRGQCQCHCVAKARERTNTAQKTEKAQRRRTVVAAKAWRQEVVFRGHHPTFHFFSILFHPLRQAPGQHLIRRRFYSCTLSSPFLRGVFTSRERHFTCMPPTGPRGSAAACPASDIASPPRLHGCHHRLAAAWPYQAAELRLWLHRCLLEPDYCICILGKRTPVLSRTIGR